MPSQSENDDTIGIYIYMYHHTAELHLLLRIYKNTVDYRAANIHSINLHAYQFQGVMLSLSFDSGINSCPKCY